MKLVITGYCLYFQFHYYAKFLTHAKMNNTELYLIHCTFLNIYKKFTSFCQVIKEMHAKENWFHFSASRCIKQSLISVILCMTTS